MTYSVFNTPANERSFSGLIDRVLSDTGRLGSLPSVVGYANATIRECQALGLFAQDLLEEEETATENPHTYFRPNYFRSLRAVKYGTQGISPVFRQPGKDRESSNTAYFYGANNYFIFAGVLIGEVIGLANYYWAKPLRYFGQVGTNTEAFVGGPYDPRPAYYDLDTNTWMYLDDDDETYVDDLGDDDEEELRQANASNWLVQDWYELIVEGTKAKLFKAFNDQRATLSFALYKNMQETLRTAGGFEAELSAHATE